MDLLWNIGNNFLIILLNETIYKHILFSLFNSKMHEPLRGVRTRIFHLFVTAASAFFSVFFPHSSRCSCLWFSSS